MVLTHSLNTSVSCRDPVTRLPLISPVSLKISRLFAVRLCFTFTPLLLKSLLALLTATDRRLEEAKLESVIAECETLSGLFYSSARFILISWNLPVGDISSATI